MSIQDARDAARAGDYERAAHLRARDGELLLVKWSDVRWRWTYDHIMHLGTEQEWWSFQMNLMLRANRHRFWQTYAHDSVMIDTNALRSAGEPIGTRRPMPMEMWDRLNTIGAVVVRSTKPLPTMRILSDTHQGVEWNHRGADDAH